MRRPFGEPNIVLLTAQSRQGAGPSGSFRKNLLAALSEAKNSCFQPLNSSKVTRPSTSVKANGSSKKIMEGSRRLAAVFIESKATSSSIMGLVIVNMPANFQKRRPPVEKSGDGPPWKAAGASLMANRVSAETMEGIYTLFHLRAMGNRTDSHLLCPDMRLPRSSRALTPAVSAS